MFRLNINGKGRAVRAGRKQPLQSREKSANSGRPKITNFNRVGNSTVSRDSQGTGYASPMSNKHFAGAGIDTLASAGISAMTPLLSRYLSASGIPTFPTSKQSWFIRLRALQSAGQTSRRPTYSPKYDKRVCVAQSASREAYLARDRHLVDGSAYCIAYCTRNSGGTAYRVRYAKQHGVEIYNVAE